MSPPLRETCFYAWPMWKALCRIGPALVCLSLQTIDHGRSRLEAFKHFQVKGKASNILRSHPADKIAGQLSKGISDVQPKSHHHRRGDGRINDWYRNEKDGIHS